MTPEEKLNKEYEEKLAKEIETEDAEILADKRERVTEAEENLIRFLHERDADLTVEECEPVLTFFRDMAYSQDVLPVLGMIAAVASARGRVEAIARLEPRASEPEADELADALQDQAKAEERLIQFIAQPSIDFPRGKCEPVIEFLTLCVPMPDIIPLLGVIADVAVTKDEVEMEESIQAME